MNALALMRSDVLPVIEVDVVEPAASARRGRLACEIETHVQFDTARLESYFFAEWQPVLFDALLVAASVEFCDRTKARPAQGWGREIVLRIPVHDADHWNSRPVSDALHDALELLTGDVWHVSFCARRKPEAPPRQGQFSLGGDKEAVIPFSDGLDSRAVAGLMARELGDRLVRVRLGKKGFEGDAAGGPQPFTSVPYKVRESGEAFVESSARSRGFKFALLSGLSAYLAGARRIFVPESGQGSLGPTLVPVGQVHLDYRSHPLFTSRMEKFLFALFGAKLRFEFPRLWFTKGETLAEYVRDCPDGPTSWASTWSCWQQNRHVSVDHHKRQCGICAACMLRRLAVRAAQLTEEKKTYVWENLSAASFEEGAAAAFTRITGAMREYAIAGTLHLEHLARLRRSPADAATLSLSASQLSQTLGLHEEQTRARLDRLLMQHESEWTDFLQSLGPDSFIAGWAGVR